MRLTRIMLGIAIAAAPLAMASPVAAQATAPAPDTALLDARLAWERGDYPEALRAFTVLLESAGAERYLDEIALITGELYKTTG